MNNIKMTAALMIFCSLLYLVPCTAIANNAPNVEITQAFVDSTELLNVTGVIHNGLKNWTLGVLIAVPGAYDDNLLSPGECLYVEQAQSGTPDAAGDCSFGITPFPMLETAKSGLYTVVVTGQGLNLVSKEFRYSGVDELKLALMSVVGADGVNIGTALLEKPLGSLTNAEILGINNSEYNGIQLKSVVNAIIDEQDGNFIVDNIDPLTPNGANVIKQNIIKFRLLFENTLAIGKLGGAKTSEEVKSWFTQYGMQKKLGEIGYDPRFDFNGEHNPGTENAALNQYLEDAYKTNLILEEMSAADVQDSGLRVSSVYSALTSGKIVFSADYGGWKPYEWEKNTLEDYNINLIRVKMQERILLSMIRYMSFSYIRSKILDMPYFFNIDFNNYNNLSDTNQYKVFQNVAGNDYNSIALFKQAFENEAERLFNLQNGTPSQSGSISNSSSGKGSYNVAGGNGAIQPTPMPSGDTLFVDLDGVDWANEAITDLVRRKVISGKGDNRFEPNGMVTRAEFIKMIVGAFNLYVDNADSNFKDINAGDWFYKYVASAERLGIIEGNEDGMFIGNEQITRQDMITALYRMAKKTGLTLPDKGTMRQFSDAGNISEYARQPVDIFTKIGIVNGMENGTFDPLGMATRAQAAKIIYDLVMLIEK